MPDPDGLHHDPLAGQALLYAGGELSDADAAAFEHRLAADQAVRDALVQAVQLAQPLHGRPASPDPDYRRAVRQRLRPAWSPWQFLFGRRTFRGHPLLWSMAGGALAALLLLVFLPRPEPGVVVVTAAPPGESSIAEEPPTSPDDDALDVARAWAEIPKGDHLMRAREEEIRRKVRAEDRSRNTHGDERRERPLSNSNTKR
jgi:hypothetical protein